LPEQLGAMGFLLVAYPLTLLASAAYAMRQAVTDLQNGKTPDNMLSFSELKDLVRFAAYDEAVSKTDT
jgi:2-methylisocitrate lyase-like PEP mutase family enzyme